MHLVQLCGAAVLALTVSNEAQALDRWQPADCASLEANSLEAAVLKCDPANHSGSEPTGATLGRDAAASSWWDAADHSLPLAPSDAGDGSDVIGISSKDW